MVRRHQPTHLRAEPARHGAPPKTAGQPVCGPAKSPAHAAWLSKTTVTGLHFRQDRQTRYVRRRPRHLRPVGTLRTSSTVLATLSLPLAAITMLGVPTAIAAPGPGYAATEMAAPSPLRGTVPHRSARVTTSSVALTAFSRAHQPVRAALDHFGRATYPFSGTDYHFGGADYLFDGVEYPFDGFYHPRLATKSPRSSMVRLAAPGSIAAFGDATFLGAPGGHTATSSGSRWQATGEGTGPWVPAVACFPMATHIF